jgi:hypothetical protein
VHRDLYADRRVSDRNRRDQPGAYGGRGLITPPYGLALLMASKFVGVRFSQALHASLSIYVVFFATIAAAIFLPDVVLWLPKHLFPESVGCFKNPSGAGYICP